MPYPSSMLELAGANSFRISRFIGDMQQAHGMSSLRARYISKTDERGDRTKVLVLFVRTGKENIVDRMINFFDKAAQNRLAVTAIQQRIPGFFQAVGNQHGSVVGLPKSISVNAAAAQSDARKNFALSAIAQRAAIAFQTEGEAAIRGKILPQGCTGMAILVAQPSFDHDMRLIRQRLKVGTEISEAEFSKTFLDFAKFAAMLPQLAATPTGSLSVEEKEVIDQGLIFCNLWIAATEKQKQTEKQDNQLQPRHSPRFHSLQGWAIGEVVNIAAPVLGQHSYCSQTLPSSLYGLSDLNLLVPAHVKGRLYAYTRAPLIINALDLKLFG